MDLDSIRMLHVFFIKQNVAIFNHLLKFYQASVLHRKLKTIINTFPTYLEITVYIFFSIIHTSKWHYNHVYLSKWHLHELAAPLAAILTIYVFICHKGRGIS